MRVACDVMEPSLGRAVAALKVLPLSDAGETSLAASAAASCSKTGSSLGTGSPPPVVADPRSRAALLPSLLLATTVAEELLLLPLRLLAGERREAWLATRGPLLSQRW
jgi:hypothetical protein